MCASENLQYSWATAAETGLDLCLMEEKLSASLFWQLGTAKTCSDVLLWLVMVFLFEEKQLCCLHNKSSWHGMRCNCVVCEQCDLASSFSPRKVALFSGVPPPPFCIVQWILYFCLCCNLYNSQIYSHIPVWSNTTRKWHHTNSHVPEIKKWAKGRPCGSQTGHPWTKQRRGPKLCSGACFSHLSSVLPCSVLNLD